MISKIQAALSSLSGSSVSDSAQMSFCFPGGCCEAADTKIDPCQHTATSDTTRDINNCGCSEDLQTRMLVPCVSAKMGGKESVREFTGLHIRHLSVSGTF